MSIKSEKLVKNIQEIQQFVAARTAQHQALETISQTLEKSVASLKEGKLILQIVSPNAESIQSLYDLIRTCEPLSASYQFRLTPLSEDMLSTPPEPTATLSLLTASNQQLTYQLSKTSKLPIGRHPECSILIPDRYLLVSGCHAEIRPCDDTRSDPARPNWQICDSSRNGTYVNGQRVRGCQTLQEGDRITLGAPTATATSPELIFEYPFVLTERNEQVEALLTECDVLCLVINPDLPLTPVEQQLIEKVSTARSANLLANFLIVAKTSLTDSAQAARNNIFKINTWLQPSISSAEVFLLPSPDHCKTEIAQTNPMLQQELDEFFKLLESLVKRKPEDILAKRLTVQILAQLSLIEQFFEASERKLARESQRDQAKLKAPEQNCSKATIAPILKQICDDKTAFFKQAKDRLKQSKVDLLDDYLENSISCKIRRFVDQLKPHVIKQQGRKYIQLRFSTIKVVEPQEKKRKASKPEAILEEAIDANTALMNFCRSELSGWADEEWEMLYMNCSTGLRGLFQKTYEMLYSIPSLKLNRSLFQPQQSIDHQAVFAEAFAMPVSESRYQEASPAVYILKRVRSQWMQFIFMFSFVSVLGIAGRRQIMQNITAPIISAFKGSPYISSVVLVAVLYFLFRFLIRLYREDRDAEREKEAEKIRNNLRSYYQALVKNRLVEKVVQNLNVALDAEDQRVETILQTVKQQSDRITTETDRDQAPLKQRISKHEVWQKQLKNDRDKLQKLKRALDVRG